MICTDDVGFDATPVPCTREAVVFVTVTGARAFDAVGAPRCRSCALIAARIVAKYYPAGSYAEVPVPPAAS